MAKSIRARRAFNLPVIASPVPCSFSVSVVERPEWPRRRSSGVVTDKDKFRAEARIAAEIGRFRRSAGAPARRVGLGFPEGARIFRAPTTRRRRPRGPPHDVFVLTRFSPFVVVTPAGDSDGAGVENNRSQEL
jgi:hypothetical protein